MDLEVLFAIFCMPMTMLIAGQGWIWLICAFAFLPIILIIMYCKTVKYKIRTRFFLAWSLTSFFFLLGVFELEVVPYLEILFMENFLLMCFVATMCFCMYMAKSYSTPDSFSAQSNDRCIIKIDPHRKTRCEICSIIQPPRTYHCELCGHCVQKKDHHSIWLDICVGYKNHRLFMVGLMALLAACLYGSNLTLTTICHPTLLYGFLLVPDDCSDVYGDIHVAICFVSAVYTLGIALVTVLVLLQQIWLVSNNTTFQEWKKGQLGLYSKGIVRNFINFCKHHP